MTCKSFFAATPGRHPLAAGASVALALVAAPSIASAAAELTVSPETPDFGEVRVDTDDPLDIDLENTGDESLEVQDFTEVGTDCSAFDFTLPSVPFTLEPGEKELVSVTFTPPARGVHACDLEIDTDVSGPADTSELEGTGVAPFILVDPEEDIAFPDTRTGETSAEETFVIQNEDENFSDDLTLSISLGGSHPGEFDVQDCSETDCTLAPGESVTVASTFSPQEPGERSALLSIDHDDPDRGDIDIGLSGTGLEPAITLLSAGAIDFGDVRVDSTSESETVEIQNDGNTDLEIQTASIEGTNPDDFEITQKPDTTPFSVAEGDTAAWELACAPTARGSLSAVFSIESDDPDTPSVDVSLSCNGTEAELATDPSPIEFPITRVGETSLESFSLVNEGNVDLEIESLSLSVSVLRLIDPPTTPFVIPAGGSEELTMEFAPEESADVSATLTAQAPELDSAAEFTVNAPGRLAEAEYPLTVDFGDVRVDGDPETREVVLTNIGDAAFEVSEPFVEDGINFSIEVASGSLPRQLEPGESATFELAAHPDPDKIGELSTTATLPTDIPDGQFLTIDVSATAIAPDLEVSDLAIDFGAHDVLADPALRVLTVENRSDASAPLEIESPQIAGPGAEVYAIPNDGGLPSTLEPGQSVELTLAYDPVSQSSGEPQATLVITSDLRVAEIPLFGRGIDRDISVDPLSVIFPETYRHPESPPTRSVEVQNLGEAPLALATAVVGGAAPEAFQVSGELPATLASGESTTIDIAFAPSVASSSPLEASLVLESDDRDQPAVEIGLAGQAVLPNLAMTPGRIDLGRTGVDVPVRRPDSVTVENRDDEETLVVEDLRLAEADASFALEGWGGDAVELEPGEALQLDVEFAPASPGVHEAYVEIYLEGDPERVAVTELRGEGMPFRVRGSGCHASGRGGLAGSLWLVFAAAALAMGQRRRRVAARPGR